MSSELLVAGCGHDGRLGLGREQNSSAWIKHPFFVGDNAPVRIFVGGFHSFVQTKQHAIYGFGLNQHGQLGLGESTAAVLAPRLVPFFKKGEDVADIRCGSYHTVALLRDGSVYVCGGNEHGQLGLGDREDRQHFTKLDIAPSPSSSSGSMDANTARSVMMVSAGTYHTLIGLCNVVLSENGEKPRFYPFVVAACGNGDYGELGYDPDSWDLLSEQERRVKQQVLQRSRNRAERSNGDGEGVGLVDDNWKAKFKSKVQVKARRAAFSSPIFKPVRHPLLDAQSLDLSMTDRSCSNPHPAAPFELHSIEAMHLHSIIVVRDVAKHATVSHHFGCYFNGDIEGLESSRPTPSLCGDDGARYELVHAGSDVAFGVRPLGNGADSIAVMGKGNLGAGDDDAFAPRWQPWPAPIGQPIKLRRCVGKYHFFLWLDDVLTEPADAQAGTTTTSTPSIAETKPPQRIRSHLLGFGDNLMGQLGANTDHSTITTPIPVLPPHTAIHDVQCGHRHSFVLIERTPQ